MVAAPIASAAPYIRAEQERKADFEKEQAFERAVPRVVADVQNNRFDGLFPHGISGKKEREELELKLYGAVQQTLLDEEGRIWSGELFKNQK